MGVYGVVSHAVSLQTREIDIRRVLVAVPAILGAVALAASLLPARRASRIDPANAIRAD